jgi:HD-GYP domain-containing protein (c-di-GMP phosphodiesterase class II)
MTRTAVLRAYVAGVVLAATSVVALAWGDRVTIESLWGPIVVVIIAFALQLGSTRLRDGNAQGSLSFVAQLAGGLLFGAFWGALLAAIPVGLWALKERKPPIKLIFNVAQSVLAVGLAFTAYDLLGGGSPPTFMVVGEPSIQVVLVESGAFLVAALIYFLTNSILVSTAVALSSGRPLGGVWSTNTFWVLRYDLTASLFSLLVAWLYLRLDNAGALGKVAFLVLAFFLGVMRRVYFKLNQTQDLLDQLGKAHEQLGQNVRDVLAMMVKSIEARDPYTSGHSRRVGALAKAIAVESGLPEDEVEKVENAALLHDVGKIHAEFAPLLAKDGRLTPEEWEIMKTHSDKSAELVGLFAPFRGDVELMVRYHHERWDGKGYPEGVEGNQIPFGARIIMISDTIDAMTTDRPYRKALGFEVVVSELQKYRGIQFDPELVDATIRSMTVRRMVSEPEFFAEKAIVPTSRSVHPKAPLRSQRSFWEGIRSIGGSGEASGPS